MANNACLLTAARTRFVARPIRPYAMRSAASSFLRGAASRLANNGHGGHGGHGGYGGHGGNAGYGGNDERQRRLRVTLIEGTGPSGPAVCAAVRKTFDAAGVPVQWDRHALHAADRRAVNADAVRSAAATGLVLCGPIPDSARGSDALALHKALGAPVGVRLFASVRGHRPYGHVRMVNIRDNVSGEYSEIEHTVAPGVVQSIKTVTRSRSEAVAKFAFDYAVDHGHYRVTALHKANVMRLSDGTFLRACRQVSARYPDVEYREEKLDTFCLRAVQDPSLYDVLLTPSLYGALASAACSTLAGGVATVPFASYGPRVAVFSAMSRRHDDDEATPAGHSMANPTGLIRSAAWLLGHVGMTDAGLRIDTALHDTIAQGVRTRDMGGTATCDHFTDVIIHNMLLNATTRPCSSI